MAFPSEKGPPQMRVLVLYNQVSAAADEAERDVLVQAEAIQDALRQLGHEPIPWGCSLRLEELKDRLLTVRPEVVFNLVESLGGSDWLAYAATGLLDVLRIPYTGSPTQALMISNDKVLAKRLLRLAGLPTPDWFLTEPDALSSGQSAYGQCSPPEGHYVIKAIREHASVGLDEAAVVRVSHAAELQSALVQAGQRLGRPVLAERFIEGREFNLSLLAGPNGPEVLPPAEIDFSAFPPEKVRIVGYAAKWDADSFEYHHTPRRFDFPASDRPLLDRLEQLALACWRLLDLGGYARVDFRVDQTGQPWILEINTNPCLSPDAGFAAAVQQAGLSYTQAIQRIVQDALDRKKGLPKHRLRSETSWPTARGPEGSGLPEMYQFRDQARPEDRQAVREIVRSTGFFNPAEIEVADELVRERLQAGPTSGYYFVFLDYQGRTIGYACYGPIAATTGSFDLYWIAVHRDCQGRGFGRAILQESERRIYQAGGRRIYIETSGRDQYAPTRRFYEHNGYQCQARLKDFYAHGDDKLIYVKEMPEHPAAET